MKSSRGSLPTATVFLAVCVFAGTTAHGNPTDLMLPGDADVVIQGEGQAQPVGDVNGDGAGDLVFRDTCAPGDVHVLFGPFAGVIDPTDHPGFEIVGVGGFENGCFLPLSAPGDVNGDGLADMLIGDARQDHNERYDSGSVYVIFGKTGEESIPISTLDDGSTENDPGFRIDGAFGSSQIGAFFSGAGDVNADGLSDVTVGAPFYGVAHVIFGKTDTQAVDLADVTGDDDSGFMILTQNNDRNWGYSVNAAGDVNADGYGDLVIGAIGDINASIGRAYVLFGKPDGETIDATGNLQGKGFRILGLHHGDATGYAVSGAGDVNGDGLDDVVIGTPRFTLSCCRGLAWVIFGKTVSGRVQVRHLRGGGFRIRGSSKLDDTGFTLAAGGDVNSDGYADILVGSPFADLSDNDNVGALNVIFGKSDGEIVKLAHLGKNGLKILGGDGYAAGYRLGGGGYDLNGDGIPDFVISTLRAREQYVVFAKG